MPHVADIHALSISLQVDGLQALFLRIDRDGSIQRLGTGAVDNEEQQLIVGQANPELFRQTLKQLADPLLAHCGAYDLPDKEGLHCVLTIAFTFADASENGFAFHYGSESQGPPQELAHFVAAALEITEPWYQRQKREL